MAARSLRGHRCIITGASRGIGAAIAHRLAAEGAWCTLIGRNRGALEGISGSLPGALDALGASAHRVVAGDVAKRGFWEGLARQEVSFALIDMPRWGECLAKRAAVLMMFLKIKERR